MGWGGVGRAGEGSGGTRKEIEAPYKGRRGHLAAVLCRGKGDTREQVRLRSGEQCLTDRDALLAGRKPHPTDHPVQATAWHLNEDGGYLQKSMWPGESMRLMRYSPPAASSDGML